MLIRYVGPHDQVEVRLPSGAVLATCDRDATVDIPDMEAARLLEQPTNWVPAPPPAPAKKAARDAAAEE